VRLDVADAHPVRVLDDGTRKQTVIAGRFGGLHALENAAAEPRVSRFKPEVGGAYLDVRMVDVDVDGRPDLVTSYGAADLPQSPGHAFYAKLNRLPAGAGLDRHAEGLCKPHHAGGLARNDAGRAAPGRRHGLAAAGEAHARTRERPPRHGATAWC
jgi:hypothetical protein